MVDIQPVSLDDLLFALRIGEAAYDGRMPTPNPAKRELVLEKQIITFSDIPFNRAMLAVSEQFRDREEGYGFAVMFRMMEVGKIRRDSLFASWCKDGAIHSDLLTALAQVPMKKGRLNRRMLLALVKKIGRDAESES